MSIADSCLSDVKDGFQNNDNNSYCDISEFAPNPDALSFTSSVDSLDNNVSKNVDVVETNFRKEVEKVETLNAEEIRWFYCTKKSKLKPMLGCDSIRLENEWRLYQENSSEEDIKRVPIRGGMYEADIISKHCYPVYWSNSDASSSKPQGDGIVRGSWFFEFNWQPLDDILADKIEKEHLERWKGIDLKEILTSEHGGVMHSVQLDGCHVDWNTVNDVLFYKDATTHRAFRNIVQKFGVSKVTSGGYRLHRGYNSPAVIYDNHLPVSHLFFVVHGIGAKSDKRKVVRNTADFRCVCRRVKPKNFTERVEFIPVEWRSKVSLDGDMVESITPKKSQTIRSFLNNTAMDVLYYASPLYRNDIVGGLRNELNRIYKHFMERNPTFDGKICVLAHSLGSVILHDILTGWRPEYEQESTGGQDICRKRCNEMDFAVDYLFCVGSPLGLFLCLRGYQLPSIASGVRDDIIPVTSCRRLFNVFHPADPVAYRLEPLILSRYKNVSPIQVCSYHSAIKSQETRSYSPSRGSPNGSPMKDETPIENDDEGVIDVPSLPTDSLEIAEVDEHQKRSSYLRSVMAVAGGAARLSRGLWHRAKRNQEVDGEVSTLDPSSKDTESETEDGISMPDVQLPDLVERIDYELPEGFTESKLGYASLTSHTSYWNNQDLAMFIMTQLLTEENHHNS